MQSFPNPFPSFVLIRVSFLHMPFCWTLSFHLRSQDPFNQHIRFSKNNSCAQQLIHSYRFPFTTYLLKSSIQRNDARGELIKCARLIELDRPSMLDQSRICLHRGHMQKCRRVMYSDLSSEVKVFILLGDLLLTCFVVDVMIIFH